VAEKLKKGYVDSGTPSASSTAQPKSVVKKPSAKAVRADTQATATTEAAPSDEPKTVTAAAEREIGLDPEDWFRAGFRPRKRLERVEARPFDKEASLKRLASLRTTTYGWDTRWQDLHLPAAMTREEAHFWFVVMTTQRDRDATTQKFAETMEARDFDGKIDPATIHDRIGGCQRGLPEQAMLPLAILLTPEQVLDLVMKPFGTMQQWTATGVRQSLITGFTRSVAPYLSDGELEALRERIRRNWDPTQAPSSAYGMFPVEFYLAACLGMHKEVLEVTSRWADDRFQKDPYAYHYQNPPGVVFGLGSAELVASEWRRLKLKVRSPDDARGLLACTEYACLDCLTDDIIAETNKDKCEALLKVLALVRAPEAAVPMLRSKMSARSPSIAREWLDRNVGHAVAGLIEPAAGRGALAEAAIDYLRDVKRNGHAEVIAAAVKTCTNAEAVAKVQAEVLDHEEKVYAPLDAATAPKWLSEALTAAPASKAKKLPSWSSPALLPPLVVGEHRMNDEQAMAVLQAIANTPPTNAHPLLAAVREHVERHVRDAFAWKVLQNWQADGYPSADKWALAAIGHIGDDGCVLKLTPLVRAWPGESQHARAVFGLECLRAVGTNVALMQLSGIAQKLKFKPLKANAEHFDEEIAKDKGLTRAELEDRIVPDCGLDENGRREFSFGPRSFSFMLGGDLKAMVRDADGKLRGDLPKPSGKDDEAAATAAIAEWKLLKKEIKQVATIQAERLEKAMVAGRRWSTADFETLLVRHPLMTHLAQKLIWATYDESGKRVATFRVTEERDFADVEESTLDIAGAHRIGVVHPLDMTEQERGVWGQVLGDYEIITPFPQLGRKVYTLEGDEASQLELTRFQGTWVVAPTLVGMLEKLGWARGVPMDGGCFDEHSKQFPAADVTAVVHYDGTVSMGYIDPNELLTLGTAYFCKGMRAPSGYGWHSENKIPLGEVSPVVISEVLSHLQALKSKAK
jgi:hypothetical protein